MKFSLFALMPAVAVVIADPAPLVIPTVGDLIPNQYIVKLKPNVIQTFFDQAVKAIGRTPKHTYGFGNFVGFAATMPPEILNVVRLLPGIDYIEQDAVVNATMTISHHMDKRTLVAQSGAGWGLGRISNRARGSTNYIFDDSAGLNTCVYVVDTGISVGHPDFQGRASFLANFAGDGLNDDGNGHGTHCAGIAGSRTFGVAKRTKLFAVKVLDSSGAGTNSGVLAGINFVGTDSKTRTGCSAGFIATMSLGGPKSTSVNAAVANVVANGVFVTVAAGNEAQDAGDSSPSSEVTAYTVGATDSNDNFASFSNFGTAVEIMAPGVGITSTWLNNQAATLSGTSMAAPHVAGVAAYLLGLETRYTPAALATRITALASKGLIGSLPTGTKNLLLYNNSGR